jgi:EmrB/QacA subfamily drug resistance transporter
VQFALLAGPLLTMLDSSVVNVAVAPIAADLHASLNAVQWTVSGYLLALGAGLAATAYLSRRFGTLPIYLLSLAGFTLASAACAGAPDVAVLIGARLVQGLAGAPMVPLAMSMLLGGAGQARAISPAAGIMLFAAPALGPALGGALIGLGSWRWIFLVNVPIGALGTLAARRIPPALAPGKQTEERFDTPGFLLLATGVTAALYGASEGGTAGWGASGTWEPLAAGAVLLGCYGSWETRHAHPVLDLTVLRSRIPALAMALTAVASVVTFAAVFLLPVFMESVQQHSAIATGLALLPQGIITGISTVAGQHLLKGISVRATVVTGFAVLAATSAGLLLIGAHTSLAVTAIILSGRSAAVGLVITPLLFALTQPLEPRQLGDANTLFNIGQRLAGSLGIALVAALYAARARSAMPVAGLHETGLLLTVLAALAIPGAAFLPKTRNITSRSPEVPRVT